MKMNFKIQCTLTAFVLLSAAVESHPAQIVHLKAAKKPPRCQHYSIPVISK